MISSIQVHTITRNVNMMYFKYIILFLVYIVQQIDSNYQYICINKY